MSRPIYLSQSAIKDFLVCKKKYYYRIFHSEESEKTDEMTLGNVVHLALEKGWEDQKHANHVAEKAMELYGLPVTYEDVVYELIDNYFKEFRILTKENDVVEYEFKVPYYDAVADNVFLVGKFDRVNKESNMVIDWKTGKQRFGNTANDIQSIIYYNSYKAIFGSYPSLVYIYLKDKKLVSYNPDESYTKIVYEEFIPEIIDSVLSGSFSHGGLFSTACKYCSFKRFCWENLGKV
jgi:CRISPR/Cas system-associated exonuclease Cas4 (RecB family)